jgi:hypothetical protein
MEEVITRGRGQPSRGQARLHETGEAGCRALPVAALTAEATGAFQVPPNLIPPDCEAITPAMLPLVELTLAQLERIAQTVPGGAANIQDIYPLAPVQAGILFHHLLNEAGGETYVLPMLFSFDSQPRLNAFIEAFQQVMARHDILRTSVLWEELPRPVQVVHRRAAVLVEELVLEPQRDPEEQLRERMRPDPLKLDLTKAPLAKLQTAADPWSDRRYALLQLHHLVGDRDSLEIMLEEVKAHLQGGASDLPQALPYRNHVAQALSLA